MGEKLLEVKGVSKIFRVGGMLRGKKLVAVDDVSLSIDSDKPVILSIVGESGCGKSTLCKMILRLIFIHRQRQTCDLVYCRRVRLR